MSKITEKTTELIQDYINSNSPFTADEDGNNAADDLAYDTAYHALTDPAILASAGLTSVNKGGKTANEILFEHGINTMNLNDDFNSQLLYAMERYAEQYASQFTSPLSEEVDKFQRWVCDECTELNYVDSPHRYKYHLTGQIHTPEELYQLFNQTK